MKRIYSILLALCVSSMLFAQLSIWNGSSDIWTKGAGTEASPYLIESAEQLAFISDMVNGGVTTYENTYFKLMTNIDLNNQIWVPIGVSEDWAFKGNFDGNNYTINNNSNSLFGHMVNAVIKRLNVQMKRMAELVINSQFKNCNIQCTNNGTFCDSAKISSFISCKSYINIHKELSTNKDEIILGGLVNKAESCSIINSQTLGNIYVCYKKTPSATNSFEAERTGCTYLGGIIGNSTQNKILSSSSACNILVVAEDGGSARGYNKNSTCYKGGIVGGIIGYSHTDTLEYCYSVSDVQGLNPKYDADSYNLRYNLAKDTCGILGIINNLLKDNSSRKKYGLVRNSYTSSPLLYDKSRIYYNYSEYVPAYGGGQQLVTREGYMSSDTIATTNSFASKDKTEASMKSASFPIILNTDSTVFIQDKFGVNDGYPIYKEQVYAITYPATDIQLTSANLNASYYALNADSIGFEYKESADKTHWYKRVSIDTLSSDSSYKLDNLATGTEYTYRFWVAQNGVFYFGEALTFTTQECSTNTYPETATICNGEEYEFANKILTKSGVYYDTLTAVNGCDSIIELTLTVSPINEIQKYDTIDAGESYDFFGNILTETGIYKHYVPAGAYCNLVIMNLYVKQPSVVVSVQSSNPSLGIVIGGGTYEKYTPITLTAIPNQGCRFVKWTDGNTDNPRVIIPESDCTYIAEFEEVNYTLTLAANDVAKGNVFGAGTYKYGTEVAINAIPNTGYQFTQWSDNDTNASRTIIITSDLSLTAYFQPIKYTIIATANDETLGTVYGSGEYAYNTSVSLMAVPQNGCEFITWSNGINSNPYTFVAVDNVTLQAIFRATSSGMEDVDVDANTSIQKILRDGQLLIIRDGKTYNVMGQEL